MARKRVLNIRHRELTDEQWELLALVLPESQPPKGGPKPLPIGCDSVDGSAFSRWPDHQIPRALAWLAALHAPPCTGQDVPLLSSGGSSQGECPSEPQGPVTSRPTPLLRTGDPRRQRDLEATFLSFAIDTDDGRYHDAGMRENFRLAFLRAGQAWDQAEARAQAKRRDSRQEKFRRQLTGLLDGQAYAHLDAATKERLLHDIPALAFPPMGMEL